MTQATQTPDQIVQRGEAIYNDRIRPYVEPQKNGQYLILDVDSGDYEVDQDEVVATKRAQARHPNGTFLALRIGYQATYNLGGRFTASHS